MKIAIPTEDQINIFKRTGRTPGFLILEIEYEQIINQEYRINTDLHNDEEEKENKVHSHLGIIEIISDTEAIIVNLVGKNMRRDLENNNISIFQTNETDIQEALAEFMN